MNAVTSGSNIDTIPTIVQSIPSKHIHPQFLPPNFFKSKENKNPEIPLNKIQKLNIYGIRIVTKAKN